MTDVGRSFETKSQPESERSSDERFVVFGWEASETTVAIVRVVCVLAIGLSFVAILQLRGVLLNLSTIGEVALSALIGVAARVLVSLSPASMERTDSGSPLDSSDWADSLESDDKRSALNQLLESSQRKSSSNDTG